MDKLIGKISGVKNIKGSLSIPATIDDYNELKNKPSIESVLLIGNKTLKQLGIDKISNEEIENIIGGNYGLRIS
jgi:hypothetical protein